MYLSEAKTSTESRNNLEGLLKNTEKNSFYQAENYIALITVHDPYSDGAKYYSQRKIINRL